MPGEPDLRGKGLPGEHRAWSGYMTHQENCCLELAYPLVVMKGCVAGSAQEEWLLAYNDYRIRWAMPGMAPSYAEHSPMLLTMLLLFSRS